MSIKLEKKIENQILIAAQGDLGAITESLAIAVYKSGRLSAHLQFGSNYDFYDLASLTKILFAVPQTMLLVDQKKIKTIDKITKHLPWWRHKNVQLKGVLSHSAGLPWWAPFYKTLDLNKSFLYRREQVQDFLSKLKISKSKKAIYSDLDFILLGFLLEQVSEKNLFEIFTAWPGRDLFPSLHFCPGNEPAFARIRYAPTEECPWRKKVLQGEVHDDNTWAFGGVSTHAGLFGSLEDVGRFGLALRKIYRGETKKDLARNIAQTNTLGAFTRRAIPKTQGDWAQGFMLPTRGKKTVTASCGKHFHSTSFGHTGFTGTSLWYDPRSDLLAVILSNRVHPTRDNKKFVEFRPKLHDIIYEALEHS